MEEEARIKQQNDDAFCGVCEYVRVSVWPHNVVVKLTRIHISKHYSKTGHYHAINYKTISRTGQTQRTKQIVYGTEY